MSNVAQQLFLDKIAAKVNVAEIAEEVAKKYGNKYSKRAQNALFRKYTEANLAKRAKGIAEYLKKVEQDLMVKTLEEASKSPYGVSEFYKHHRGPLLAEAAAKKNRAIAQFGSGRYLHYRDLPMNYSTAEAYVPGKLFPNVSKDPNLARYQWPIVKNNKEQRAILLQLAGPSKDLRKGFWSENPIVQTTLEDLVNGAG